MMWNEPGAAAAPGIQLIWRSLVSGSASAPMIRVMSATMIG
jgi:hypothetical protein